MDKDKEIKFLRKVIKAQDQLLMCYKLGGQPSEWVFDIMAKFRKLESIIINHPPLEPIEEPKNEAR